MRCQGQTEACGVLVSGWRTASERRRQFDSLEEGTRLTRARERRTLSAVHRSRVLAERRQQSSDFVDQISRVESQYELHLRSEK